eukprot:TRINITY_DN13056_c0_g1_i1.p1 TRINITY_DN13056_c0_g1~~TRINITY_DN13056_c0_g1_i1.p1  ORF type:complete len:929 (-),score=224.96 TRINITY_DN13056_c0_g1_i1:234-3020(-)
MECQSLTAFQASQSARRRQSTFVSSNSVFGKAKRSEVGQIYGIKDISEWLAGAQEGNAPLKPTFGTLEDGRGKRPQAPESHLRRMVLKQPEAVEDYLRSSWNPKSPDPDDARSTPDPDDLSALMPWYVAKPLQLPAHFGLRPLRHELQERQRDRTRSFEDDFPDEAQHTKDEATTSGASSDVASAGEDDEDLPSARTARNDGPSGAMEISVQLPAEAGERSDKAKVPRLLAKYRADKERERNQRTVMRSSTTSVGTRSSVSKLNLPVTMAAPGTRRSLMGALKKRTSTRKLSNLLVLPANSKKGEADEGRAAGRKLSINPVVDCYDHAGRPMSTPIPVDIPVVNSSMSPTPRVQIASSVHQDNKEPSRNNLLQTLNMKITGGRRGTRMPTAKESAQGMASMLSAIMSTATSNAASEQNDASRSEGSSDSEADGQGLHKVKLKSTRQARMARLKRLEMLKVPHFAKRLGISGSECKYFSEIFLSYDYDRNGTLDGAEMHDALSEIGLKPANRIEQNELARILRIEGGSLDFEQFCTVVNDVRGKYLKANHASLATTYNRYARATVGKIMFAEDLPKAYRDLGLTAQRPEEEQVVLDAQNMCLPAKIKASGIKFDKFQKIVQLIREKLYQARGKREATLCEKLRLSPADLLHFKGHLIPIHDLFCRLDMSDNGWLPRDTALNLIVEKGFERDIATMHDKARDDDMLEDLLNRDRMDFPRLLKIMTRLRELREEEMGVGGLETVFALYDVDGSGDLTQPEIFKLLKDLGLSVDSSESAMVADIIAEADKDGNNAIDVEEFKVVFARVSELLSQHRLKKERDETASFDFSQEEFLDLRELFITISDRALGLVSAENVLKVVQLVMKDKNPKMTLETMKERYLRSAKIMTLKEFLSVVDDIGIFRGWTAHRRTAFITKVRTGLQQAPPPSAKD